MKKVAWRGDASAWHNFGLAKRGNALEMATGQRTRPRAVVGAPRRSAWQLKFVLRHSVSAAPRTIIFYIFFTILLLVNYFFMSNNG